MAKVKGKIVVDAERCKGCEVCLQVCPTGAISPCAGLSARVNSRGYRYCLLSAPDNCIGCAACALVCPDGCITVYRQKTEES